jgi:prevent-host-death family protein
VAEVSIRDLRNHGGEVVDRAARGEAITITRAGRPVALLTWISGAFIRPCFSRVSRLGFQAGGKL